MDVIGVPLGYSSAMRSSQYVAGLGAAFLAAALLPVPEVGAIPLVLAVWASCAAAAVR